MTSSTVRKLVAATAAGLAVALGACGTSGTASTSEPQSTSTQAGSSIVVTDAWSRVTPPGTQVGAVYAEIAGTGEADALVGVTVPDDVAAEAQLHVSTTASPEMGMDDHSAQDGAATSTTAPETASDGSAATSATAPAMGTGMQQVERLDIPAGGTLTLAPGGNHIMLIGLAKPLVAGETFPVTMQFEKAPPQTISVEVRDG